MEQQIRKLIVEDNVDTFLLTGNGWFDIYANGVLKKLKNKYPQIRIINSEILQSATTQNTIKDMDYIIIYISTKNNKLYRLLKNKKNIINLATMTK